MHKSQQGNKSNMEKAKTTLPHSYLSHNTDPLMNDLEELTNKELRRIAMRRDTVWDPVSKQTFEQQNTKNKLNKQNHNVIYRSFYIIEQFCKVS